MNEREKSDFSSKAFALFRCFGASWNVFIGFAVIIGLLFLIWRPPSETTLMILVVLFVVVLFYRSYVIEEVLEDIKKILEPPSKESVASPGYIMSKCKWATLIKEDPKDGDVEIWVSCKQKIMTTDGCPSDCPRYELSPKSTGQGALGGMVLGGIIGLLGGPAGVLIGGLLGGFIGHGLESSSSMPLLENTLTNWKNLGKRLIIHVKE